MRWGGIQATKWTPAMMIPLTSKPDCRFPTITPRRRTIPKTNNPEINAARKALAVGYKSKSTVPEPRKTPRPEKVAFICSRILGREGSVTSLNPMLDFSASADPVVASV